MKIGTDVLARFVDVPEDLHALRILLEDVGQINVNGLTLDELRDKVRRLLSRAYSGIRDTERQSTTFVDVSLGKLRAVKVFVVAQGTGDRHVQVQRGPVCGHAQ